MRATLREEIDPDLSEKYTAFTDQKTGLNQHEIYCGTCAKVFYTDEVNSDQFRRALDHDLDNPFVCDDCKREYEELAYEDR